MAASLFLPTSAALRRCRSIPLTSLMPPLPTLCAVVPIVHYGKLKWTLDVMSWHDRLQRYTPACRQPDPVRHTISRCRRIWRRGSAPRPEHPAPHGLDEGLSPMKTNDQLEPNIFVIFGGAGDLTWRKLMPLCSTLPRAIVPRFILRSSWWNPRRARRGSPAQASA